LFYLFKLKPQVFNFHRFVSKYENPLGIKRLNDKNIKVEKSELNKIKRFRLHAKSFWLTYKFNKEINQEFIDEIKLKVLNNPRVVEFLWDYLKFETDFKHFRS